LVFGSKKAISFITGLFTNLHNTINNADFSVEAKEASCAFTRRRKFSFKDLVISILGFNKSGVQVEIDRFFKSLCTDKDHIITYTKSAFSKARHKVKADAFITLRHKQLEYFDQHAPVKNKWMGHRVVAIDGSSLTLPQEADLKNYFGTFKSQNKAERTGARISVAYDVCNHLVLDALIDKTESSEHDMAREHLSSLKPLSDLLVFDRGYPSLSFAMELDKQGFQFCFRLSTAWKEAHQLLQDVNDIDWSLKKGRRYKIGDNNKEDYLKEDIQGFRLVKVSLDNGEFEVLFTNLSDRNLYTLKKLKELYHLRWAVEECYKRIKQVGQLEFFSGRTVKAIQQDFHARIVLLNIAAMIEMQQLQPHLNQVRAARGCKHKLQVNRTQVSAKLKDFLYDIMYGTDVKKEIIKMMQLLVNAYDIVRDDRHFFRNPAFRYKRKALMYKAF